MVIKNKRPKDRLLAKIVDEANQDRIGQWIYWQALAKNKPNKFKLVRVDQDFMLLMKFEINGFWGIVQMCTEWTAPPDLKLIKK